MDMNDVMIRKFYNSTNGERLENGDWRVTCTIGEDLAMTDGTTKSEVIDAMCVDKEFDVAHGAALNSVIEELRMLVYERGFDSLVEGVEYQRKLEVNDNPKTDEDIRQ